jgi:hypothetical protein
LALASSTVIRAKIPEAVRELGLPVSASDESLHRPNNDKAKTPLPNLVTVGRPLKKLALAQRLTLLNRKPRKEQVIDHPFLGLFPLPTSKYFLNNCYLAKYH